MTNLEFTVYDLFPYKIKNRQLFYQRNHPEGLNPSSQDYKLYWKSQWRRVIEGYWVNDEGTWVFMYPKLYFYINITKIYDTDDKSVSARQLKNPDQRDNEWLIFTYSMCTLGFSGFAGDEEYTCHETIEKIENKELVDEYELNRLPASVFKSDGTYKKFVNAWDYLRIHYLITNPATKPLGIPLYDNPMRNFLILSSRGIGKSLSIFVGDFMHEFITGGVRYWEDRAKIQDSSLLFFAGSSDEKKMNKTLRMVKTFYDNMPGGFVSYNAKNEEIFTPSPFYKILQGSWALGKKLVHTFKKRDKRVEGSMSMIELNSIHAHDVATGDRYSMILAEEIGLLGISSQFYDSSKDSLKVDDIQVGRFVGLGTGGDIDRIQETKSMFTNPDAYNFYKIPNYWENISNKIGLFIPILYKNRNHKDANGNTNLDIAYNHYIKKLEKDAVSMSAKSLKTDILNNPFIPSQIFHSSKYNIFPSDEAINRLTEIDTENLWHKKATVGKLVHDPNAKYGVRFEPDSKLVPITKYLGFDNQKEDTRGACVMYEPPPDIIPKGLYLVIYDPVAKDGEGTSLNSVLVYKGASLDNDGMSENIVFEYIGRHDTLQETWELVYMISRYYNCNIFPETNTPGFVNWLRGTRKHGAILEPYAYALEREMFANYRYDANKVGYNMRGNGKDNFKFTIDNLGHDWLMEPILHHIDDPTIILKRRIDTIYSIRLLEEIAYYEEGKNFDHISTFRGLIIWLQNRRRAKLISVEDVQISQKTKINKFINYKIKKPSIFV